MRDESAANNPGRAPQRVLLLGGTSEARALAVALQQADVDVVSSLAGRVSRPRLPVGDVRVGGFGGVSGLQETVRAEGFTHIVDATHPFAVGMRANAHAAAAALGLPILRLARPGWRDHPDANSWHWVESYAEADRVAAGLGGRAFLTSGRQTLPFFERLREFPCLVRVVEPLDEQQHRAAPTWTVLLDRGPFDVESETALMREHGVDVLVTKDSGGSYTSAKLDAAKTLGIPVVIVGRPPAPEGLREVATIDAVLRWLENSS